MAPYCGEGPMKPQKANNKKGLERAVMPLFWKPLWTYALSILDDFIVFEEQNGNFLHDKYIN